MVGQIFRFSVCNDEQEGFYVSLITRSSQNTKV